jgi:hypothetical protein
MFSSTRSTILHTVHDLRAAVDTRVILQEPCVLVHT